MSETAPPPRTESDPNWSRRLKVWGGITVAILLGLLIGAAFIPRWWAQRVGDQANESFAGGHHARALLRLRLHRSAAAADRLGHPAAALGAHVAVDPRRRRVARAAESHDTRHRARPGQRGARGRPDARRRGAGLSRRDAGRSVAGPGCDRLRLVPAVLTASGPGCAAHAGTARAARWTSVPGRTFAPSP